MNDRQIQLCQWIECACRMEVLSPKPGNVSPDCEFTNSSVRDFLNSARVCAPELALAGTRSLGETILKAIEVTRGVVNHNTNLGIVLLIAPLAAVPAGISLKVGIADVLKATTVDDSRLAYRAIRLAQPGGLGNATQQDLHDEPTLRLHECMSLAAERDLIARQYANGFDDVLTLGVAWLEEAAFHASTQPRQIAWLSMRLLAEFGDSLIARKCGQEMSNVVRRKAREVLDSDWPVTHDSDCRFAEFDTFLREDGNRRNPGTTADMVAAILFAAIREKRWAQDQDPLWSVNR